MNRIVELHPRSRQLLEEAGFTWDRHLEMWVNIATGRAISFQTVRDRNPEWLEGWLDQGKG